MHFWLGEKKVDGFRMDVVSTCAILSHLLAFFSIQFLLSLMFLAMLFLQINLISKVDGLPDATITEPDNLYQPSFEMTSNGPRVHEFLQEMHREVLSRRSIALSFSIRTG